MHWTKNTADSWLIKRTQGNWGWIGVWSEENEDVLAILLFSTYHWAMRSFTGRIYTDKSWAPVTLSAKFPSFSWSFQEKWPKNKSVSSPPLRLVLPLKSFKKGKHCFVFSYFCLIEKTKNFHIEYIYVSVNSFYCYIFLHIKAQKTYVKIPHRILPMRHDNFYVPCLRPQRHRVA